MGVVRSLLLALLLLTFNAILATGARDASRIPRLTNTQALSDPITSDVANRSSATAITGSTASVLPETQRKVRVPSSIADDCSRDVTAALLQWIASVPNDSSLSFSPQGCYRVDGSLRVVGRSNLTFDGNGATFRAYTTGNRQRRFFWFVGGSDLVIRNLTVRGANPHAGAQPGAYVPALEFQHAFTFAGVTGATLDHVQAYDLYGDFVYIGSGKNGSDWSRRITIVNSQFARSGRQGISIVAGQNVDIEHDTISDVARTMFDLEPGRLGAALGVKIANNTTGAAVNFWLGSKGGPGKVGNITITDNVMRQGTGNLLWVFAPNGTTRGPFDIERNQFIVGGRVHDEGSVGAFFFAHCTGLTIRDNKASFPAGKRIPAVELRASQAATIEGNTFTNAAPPITS